MCVYINTEYWQESSFKDVFFLSLLPIIFKKQLISVFVDTWSIDDKSEMLSWKLHTFLWKFFWPNKNMCLGGGGGGGGEGGTYSEN